MKKEVNPIVFIVSVMVVLALVAFFYFRATATPPPREADPLGMDGKVKVPMDGGQAPGGVTPDVQKMMEQQRQQQQPGAVR